MRKVEIYEYYSFGYNYFILIHESGRMKNKEILNDIENYLDFIKSLKLNVTESSLRLQKLYIEIESLKKLNRGKKKEEIVPEDLHARIIEKIKNTDKTLDAELNVITAYYLHNDKRISQEILEQNVNKLFPDGVFYCLPDIASIDFEEAGKCLLFNRFTACAFHTLRGTEDVLKDYYQKLLSCVANDTQTWWNFYNEIETKITDGTIMPKPSEELMINLNSLRKYYRNKTQHPQMIYNSDEAQDLLFLCIKTVSEMIQDLGKRGLIVVLPF